MGTTDEVRDLVAPLLATHGLEVFDVEQSGAVLRLLVDRADGPGGVDLDALANATHVVSAALDEADPVPGRYTLEVSSPGVERPLRRPEHFHRAVGQRVAVKTVAGSHGERRVDGELAAVDDRAIVIRLADGGQRRLTFEEVERARTVFDWGPAPKPGSSPGKKAAKKKATRS